MVALEQGYPVVVLATPVGQNKIGPQGPLRHVAGGGPRHVAGGPAGHAREWPRTASSQRLVSAYPLA